ncbi:MAG TPA: putative hydroxymethylpyrimidine transporter CytX [Negativicutes bacterium]|nr:putative hydroxymethylpyrimidine transporter CytX [Negativicutes bacterium]
MSKNKNDLTTVSFFTLWFGAAVSVAEIMTGGLLAPLGFKMGLAAIIIGHAIGTGILVLGGVIGTEMRLPAIMSTGMTFGRYGAGFFSILNVIQLLGWTSVMIIAGARSVNQITQALWTYDNIALWSIITGGLIFLWIYAGKGGWGKLNTAAVAMLFVLTVVLSMVIFGRREIFNSLPSGDMSFGAAIELNVIMPLSWLPLIADYTRFAKRKRDGVIGSFLGYFTGSCWMYAVGLGAAIITGNSDPGAMLLAAGLGIAALGIVVLSTVTTTFLDANSAGVTLLNIFPWLEEKKAALWMAGAGTLLAIAVPVEHYENFLYMIGSVFAPLFSIQFAEYFIIRRHRKKRGLQKLNLGATLIWVFGVIMYYEFIGLDLILGATAPVMIITGMIYCLTWRFTEKWSLSEKPRS